MSGVLAKLVILRRSTLGNDIVEAGEVLRSWVSPDMVVLSAPTTNIVSDEPELDIAQISSQNV